MKFIADLHVHSRFSRATSKDLDLEHLYTYCQLKGITVVGTGDFTHPGWFEEISRKLVPAEEGLFRLRDELTNPCDDSVPVSCRQPVRYMLSCEISNIYKKNGKTRKNHNLVFMPDMESAASFIARLDRIGNIRSDGRPILGLDARDLLEIVLETSDKAFLVPAHIWTPWFSLLGSKSGFDSVDECFEDLASHIFAVETGLSSDPQMNWRVSDLDGLTLISNSDAHSPSKLGREANWFDTQLSYAAIRSAIETGDPGQFLGTFEFYPEEGKYHLDGHRQCQMCLRPEESIRCDGICPACGKPMTLGVLYRVEALADRSEGEKPERTHPYYSLIPLADILADIYQTGAATKTVQTAYMKALDRLGSEFEILHARPVHEIERSGIPLLAEAIRRVRQKQITLIPGYDGEFGRINIFEPLERQLLKGQKTLFSQTASEKKIRRETQVHLTSPKDPLPVPESNSLIRSGNQESGTESLNNLISALNSRQQEAVYHNSGPMLIVAGPGTGKTRTITLRIAYLIENKKVSPEEILAVTFTGKAAQEMKDRLGLLLSSSPNLPWTGTFHSLCFNILSSMHEGYSIIDETDRRYMIREAVHRVKAAGIVTTLSYESLLDHIISAKQQIVGHEDNPDTVAAKDVTEEVRAVYSMYQQLLMIQQRWDYEDLLFKTVRLLETDSQAREAYRHRYPYIFVDEYQDLNQAQYRLIKALSPETAELCVIGDPDQSIYGFRGSDARYFNRFMDDYPAAKIVHLNRNYRSTETILKASQQIIAPQHMNSVSGLYSGIDGIRTISILEQTSETSEAVAVGKIIEQLVGGIGFHSIDYGNVDGAQQKPSFGFSDFAVLFRTGAQVGVYAEVFEKAGIPFQRVSREIIWESEPVVGLLSLLKITDQAATYADVERVIKITGQRLSGKTMERFKEWSYENRFSVQDALIHAGRFPIPGMSRSQQAKLYEVIHGILNLKDRVKGLTVEEKLLYLKEHAGAVGSSDDRETLEFILRRAASFGTNSRQFLSSAALQTDTDTWSQKAEKVSLMTMHAAKGLEFPVVFISGCEADLIPLIRSEHHPSDVQEERRLFYVAMTRAKEQLYLTYSRKRRLFGTLRNKERSPFIDEIEQELRRHESGCNASAKTEKGQMQLKLF